jgi:hypothetical protein
MGYVSVELANARPSTFHLSKILAQGLRAQAVAMGVRASFLPPMVTILLLYVFRDSHLLIVWPLAVSHQVILSIFSAVPAKFVLVMGTMTVMGTSA